MAETQHEQRQIFVINLTIGKEDYTANLRRCRIVSSAATKYHTIILELSAESELILKKDLFWRETIIISINKVSEDKKPEEIISMELLCLHTKGLELKSRSIKSISEETASSARDVISLACVPTESYKRMSHVISKCFMEDFNKPPLEAVKYIADNFLVGMQYKIDDGDKNPANLPKTFNVQPMAFSTFLDWLDGKHYKDLPYNPYGPIYLGPFVAFYGLDKFYMHSIRHKLTQKEEYSIHLLSTDNPENAEIIAKTANQDDYFYTRIPIVTQNLSQEDIGMTGYKQVVRSKPADDLFEEFELNTTDIFKDNVVHTGSSNISDIHEILQNTTKYRTKQDGNPNDMDRNWLKIQIARSLSFQSEILIQLSRKLSIKKLMKIGVPIQFYADAVDYLKYEGRYITMATNIIFDRWTSEIYNCTCQLRCFRGNPKEG